MFGRKNKMMFGVGLFAICAVLISATNFANAQVNYALMVQQTPTEGGTVTPDVGVHNVAANGAVTITATPKAGYQFVSWLGDVSDPTSNRTVVSVGSPKMVIAVFERSEYELPFEAPAPAEGSGGGGGDSLSGNRGQYVGGGGGISPASGPTDMDGPTYVINSQSAEGDDPPPVPGDGEVPEPATMALLGIGAIAALRVRRSNN